MLLEVLHAAVGVAVVLGGAVLAVDGVALEPLLETHRAHDVVVGHRVEGVEGVLDALLGRQADLPGSGAARPRLPVEVEHLAVLEAPGLQDDRVGVVGLCHVVLLVALVEEEDLRGRGSTRLERRNQSLSCDFSQTASVRRRYSWSYYEKSLPASAGSTPGVEVVVLGRLHAHSVHELGPFGFFPSGTHVI